DMLGLVGDEALDGGEARRGLRPALALLPRQAERVIHGPQPRDLGDALEPRDLLRRQELAADIAFGEEREVAIERHEAPVARLPQAARIAARENGREVFDLGVALHHLEPGAN